MNPHEYVQIAAGSAAFLLLAAAFLVPAAAAAGAPAGTGATDDARAAAAAPVDEVLPGVAAIVPRPRSGLLDPAPPAFGLRLPADRDRPAGAAGTWLVGAGPAPDRVVLLIHGLDDPGWVFKDLLRPLREAGHVPVELIYPNDGPIAEAADRLGEALRTLRVLGVKRVDVVAHSMGGLVTRDVLTCPEHYGGDARGDRDLPSIDRFVMCGTPNLGSRAAHMRWLAEAREHLTRSLSGRGHLLGGLRDGRGEAGHDLLPTSEFLTELNRRPRPEHVRITCVVGHATPLDPHAADRMATAVREALDVGGPRWWRRLVGATGNAVATAIDGTVDGLGDGVVTIASASLPGASDVVLVAGNHASMLARVLPVGEGVPPAIPVVLDRLDRADADADANAPAASPPPAKPPAEPPARGPAAAPEGGDAAPAPHAG